MDLFGGIFPGEESTFAYFTYDEVNHRNAAALLHGSLLLCWVPVAHFPPALQARDRLVHSPQEDETEDQRLIKEAKTWGSAMLLAPSSLCPGGILYIVATDSFGSKFVLHRHWHRLCRTRAPKRTPATI